jgi:hypothetical protein
VEGISSYIDQAMIGGVLTGLLVGVGILWLLYAQNSLWRLSLEDRAGASLRHVEERFGLTRVPPGFGPQVRSRGSVGNWQVELAIRGGIRGDRVDLKARGPAGVIRQRGSLERVMGDLDVWLMDHLDLLHEE